MTAPTTPPAPEGTRSFAARYGPLIGIVVVIALVAIGVTVAGRGKDGAGDAAPRGSSGPASELPITYAEAVAKGSAATTDWGPDCDPKTGLVKMPTIYSPPCVPEATGDNGGATSTGVAGDKVTVVYYSAPLTGDLLSAFASNIDPPEQVAKTIEGYSEMFNTLFETYGRKVEIVQYQAKGGMSDPVAAAADAQAVIDQFHPFASINGPMLTNVYAEELARNNILCLNCGSAVPDSIFQQFAPHMWGNSTSPEEFLQIVSDYIIKRMAGRPASYAGGALKDKPRTYGVVHFELDPPVFKSVEDANLKCGAQIGWSSTVNESYLFDIGRLPERAVSIIAKLKSANVTTVVFLGDPLMPIYLTKEATAQGYFPEWVVTGTAFTDTSVLGRRYDQAQWDHAFGLSTLPVRLPREQLDAWRLYQWYFGQAPPAVNTNAVVFPAVLQLFQGIHLAGKTLTPDTFRQALFQLPPVGGGPTTPHESYGDHGYFKTLDTETCQYSGPMIDYLGSDDMTEIWWDPTATGPDEQGKAGTGLWRYANGGRRYLPGQMPATPVDAFKVDGSIAGLDAPTKDESAPTYPSPTGK